MPIQLSPADQALLDQGARAIDPSVTGLAAPTPPTENAAGTRPGSTPASSAALFPHDEREDDLGEALEVGAYQFANQAAMGIPGLVLDHILSDDDKQIWEAAKDRHPLANYAAGTLGFGASMLLGGPLFRAAAKGGAVARSLVMGGEAAEDVARTASAIHAAADLTEPVASTAGDVLSHAALGQQVAEETLPKAVEAMAAEAPEHAPAIRDAVQAGKDAVTEHLADRLGGAGADPIQVSQAITNAGVDDTVQLGKVATDAAAKAAPGLPRKLLAKAVGYAVEGAIVSAPTTLTEAALGDPKGVAESLVAGMGANVALGGIGEILGAGAGKLHDIVKETLGAQGGALDKLGQLARREVTKQTLKAVGVTKGMAKEFGEERLNRLVDWAHDSGIMGQASNKQEVGALVEQAHADAAKQVEQLTLAAQAAPKEQAKDLGAQLAKAKQDLETATDAMNAIAEQRKEQVVNRAVGTADGGTRGLNTVAIIGALAPWHPLAAGVLAAKHMAGKLMEDRGTILLPRYLRQVTNSPDGGAFGIEIARQAVQKVNDRLATVPDALKSGTNLRLNATRATAQQAMTPDRFKESKERLDSAVTGPAQQHAQFAANMVSKGAPNAGAAYAQTLTSAVQWLHSQLPKPPNQGPVQSFDWQPTTAELRAYGDKESIVKRPLSIVDRIRDGTLSSDHVLALRQNFPSLYGRVCAEALNAVQGQVPTIQQRNVLSTLLGRPLSPSGQAPPQAPQPPPDNAAQAQGQNPKQFPHAKLGDLPDEATDAQRARSNEKA